VTYLFTDIEGSTRLWQQDEAAMGEALSRHDDLLRQAVDEEGGTVFSTMGDGLAAAFSSALSAIRAALAGQRLLGAEVWPTPTPIRVRMGLHTGEAELRDGDYFGTAVNRAARLMAVGHGGQVLCSQATAALVESEIELVDLGEHRLRDLDRPIRVFQVGAGAFAPLRSLDVLPGNLPLVTTSFVGRRAELAVVADDLRSHRLVTLTGVGGVGKTRLAVQVAAELAGDFTDGVWLCELAAAATDEAIGPLVASALGVLQRPQMSLGESIVDFLRTREALVMLDNCEHLLDAAAALAEAVLEGAPGVRVLATSREGLGVPAEQVRPVRSLPVPASIGTSTDAVVLFEERARAVDPDFILDDATTRAVAEVCRRLDGIPLAIELAAARVASMGPAEIAGHLDERFRLLTGGRRGRVERHQTLRAAIEWSYSLLSAAERAVFDRMGAFPASFDEPAAVAVCAGDGVERWDVIDGLGSLVAKSMVGADRSAGATRYQLLETLRHYARDQAGAEGTIDRLRRRHAIYYARLAEEAGPALMSPDELLWRQRVAADLDNFRAATLWAFDAAAIDDVALGVRILDGLMIEALTMPSSAVQTWADPALVRVDELGPAQRGVVLAAAALQSFLVGDLARGESLAARVIAEWAAPATALSVAILPATYGPAASREPTQAMSAMADTLARLEAEGADDLILGQNHATASWLACGLGDLATARSEAERALAAARRSGTPTALVQGLATHARFGGDGPEESLAAAEEALRLIGHGAGDIQETSAHQTAAICRLALGDRAGAARDTRAAIELDARHGNRMFLANDLFVAAQVLAADPGGLQAAAMISGAISGAEFGQLPLYFEDTYGSANRDRTPSGLRAALGADAYTRAHEAGMALTYDQIIDFALIQLGVLVWT
jgi:predicted ATPase